MGFLILPPGHQGIWSLPHLLFANHVFFQPLSILEEGAPPASGSPTLAPGSVLSHPADSWGVSGCSPPPPDAEL